MSDRTDVPTEQPYPGNKRSAFSPRPSTTRRPAHLSPLGA